MTKVKTYTDRSVLMLFVSTLLQYMYISLRGGQRLYVKPATLFISSAWQTDVSMSNLADFWPVSLHSISPACTASRTMTARIIYQRLVCLCYS